MCCGRCGRVISKRRSTGLLPCVCWEYACISYGANGKPAAVKKTVLPAVCIKGVMEYAKKSPAKTGLFLLIRFRLRLGARLVFTGAGVDRDKITDLYECRYLQFSTVVQTSGFHDFTGGVATYCRFGVGDFTHDGGRWSN